MKMKTGLGRKLRYGGVTAVLTAAIIAIVIIVNVIFSALAQKHLWYTDLTPELFFTLSENCITLMKEGDSAFEKSTSPIKKIDEYREAAKKENPDAVGKDIRINIIFCNDELTWTEDTAQRYVLETAKQLRDEFPDYISIEYVDVIRNPTAVTKYGSGVTTSSVIIECKNDYDNAADATCNICGYERELSDAVTGGDSSENGAPSENPPATEPEQSGCKSSVTGGIALVAFVALGAGIAFKKKRK
jgi:hypothetical protein